MEDLPELRLAIGSRFDDLELVDLLLEEVADHRSLSESEREKLALSVREAAANAIRHGNRLDENKSVEICVGLEPGAIVVTVRDMGEGFDPSALPDPLDPANLLKPSGRGIFLMRRLMDEVTFDFPAEGGTVVTMRQRVAPGAAADG